MSSMFVHLPLWVSFVLMLLVLVQGWLPLNDFLGHICLESYVQEPAGHAKKAKGAKKQKQTEVQRTEALTISTIHAAKGLEYDTVWVVRWVEGFLPARLRNEENQEMKDLLAHEEEETRLAHVVSAVCMMHAEAKACREQWAGRIFGTVSGLLQIKVAC